ncbi:histone-like nucleoid-structuring protein, MvaT/MvaU family [Pseudomonas chlororaphis]|uniref:Transcriptional regulator TurD n=1 Tax=Pseudomonas chlororaphis TaxID=587753 RepID=A0AAX3FRJ1_9PSED|nr:histone-like nucleoid-structuring protein, MvaT/MvaU family [Pseudomonas chlororaphis]AZC38280.1 transcriptional regulator MvaT, P16 subunit, putative [Pseudomonas chlororaphis subsp. piscium]AZC44829.1 transcriptional regulator MvaT, P16 subunit, putative [Pseudomonas chlororaphis subsp. piscium]WDG70431.1 DNA binding protein [Pseudomonas chlororaphis]WDG77554.1 DNA binding protein [Pseudomonas chlororaphis]WDG83207.1 DNA binding protein [Pseudomonas chlororaphis]
MSRLAEFRKLEQQLAEQLAELESMKSDSGLKKEMEFESKLRALLGEYGFSLKNIISILDPEVRDRTSTPGKASVKAVRKAREVKIYKNPNSGELIETKGGNHRQLKEWKAEFGVETVESWRIQ